MLYTMTLTRADTPTQLPVGELYREGTLANVAEGTAASKPFVCRNCSACEFSV